MTPKTPTAHSKLLGYARSCGNGSHFNCCLKHGRNRFDRIWEATITLWWLNHKPLVATGRTRESACRRLRDTVGDYYSLPEVLS